MRTSLILSLIGISLLCFSLSCGKRAGSIPAELARADSLLAVCPDSAARYLASLDSLVREEPERVRMYYALQKIKADDKCYVTHTTDSVIRAVVRYYTDAGDPDLLMETYYYLGSVYRDMGDAPRAVEAFQKVVDIGQESGSERYDLLGRSYEQIGYRLAYQGLYNEALEAYKKSYNYNADRPKGKIYALRNIARMYNAINEVDSAICYYMRAYDGMRLSGDSSMKDNVLSELSAVYIRKKAYGKAKGVFNLISNQDDVNVYWGLGSIYRDSFVS